MSSSIDLVAAYLRERCRAWPFVPLAVFLATAGAIATGPHWRAQAMSMIVVGSVVAYCLVLAFRVWDDLEDRGRDAVEHPERVVVRATTRAPFVGLIVVAAGVAIVIMMAGPAGGRRIALLLGGAVALFTWYRARRGVIGVPVILAKYPLIAYVAVPVQPPEDSARLALIVLFLVYLALFFYDMVDGAQIRGSVS